MKGVQEEKKLEREKDFRSEYLDLTFVIIYLKEICILKKTCNGPIHHMIWALIITHIIAMCIYVHVCMYILCQMYTKEVHSVLW